MSHKVMVYVGIVGLFVATGLFLQACAPALVAGGAAAGYYVGKDERSVSGIVDDAGITMAVKSRLIKDKDVSALDINVDTRNGVVTLYGSVGSVAEETRAIALTKQAKGVKKIISKITVVPRE